MEKNKTPSQEAKQAAEEEVSHWLAHADDPLDEARERGNYVQQAIDTATAKLREELDAKDGEIRHWQFQAELRAKDALAHQQPSAPTADVEDDVQMALRAADAKDAGHWPTVAGVLADEVRRLAQVRAPLVEALERMFQCHILYCKQCSGPDDGCDQGERLEEIKLTALTGTGEKEDLAGRTGNNKQKGE